MQSEYKVVACSNTIEGTVRAVVEWKPDMVIVCAFEQHSSFTAIELLDELSRIGSSAHAIILSSHPTSDETVAYFRAQARGILSGPNADFAVLCKCVNCVHSGQIWATSEQLVCLIKSLSRSKKMTIVNAKGLPILSAREEEVLHLLAKGLSNRDMATILMLSEHTVRNHLFHIFDKLGVSSRMEAVLYAFNHLEGPMHSAKSPTSLEKMAMRVETEHSRSKQSASI